MAKSRRPAPSYPLEEVRALAACAGKRHLTATAAATARTELEMTVLDVFAAVAKLHASDFYKTMPSEREPGLFQDVYRPTVVCPAFPRGVRVYCKVQIINGVIVISFKQL